MSSIGRVIQRQTHEGAFTIIELLIALVIIGILTSLAVVNIANRADDARLRAAQSDLISIRKGLEHAALDTGYYYRLYVLNDVPGGDGNGYDGTQPPPAGLNTDGIQDERFNLEATNPIQIFLDLDGNHLTNTRATTVFTDQLAANETAFGWKGAYVNWSREWINPATGHNTGNPLDPWGNPYLLFTQRGYMAEPDGVLYDNYPNLVSTGPRDFDRMTLLSFGPDGVPGDVNNPGSNVGSGDDLKTQW